MGVRLLMCVGENNASAKFTNEQVIEIYHSTESIDVLASKYNVTRYNIITIKRKIYYRSVTGNITELPGFSEIDIADGKSGMFTMDMIALIFYDSGDYMYFWKKYRASAREVRSIKSKKTYKKITSVLGVPGQVKRYGLTHDMVDEIYESTDSFANIAKKFGIHYNTVRNIKGAQSRAFSMWDEF